MKIPFILARKFLPRKVWHQLLVIIIFMVVIPLIIMGMILIDSSRASLKSTVLRNCKQVSLLASEKIRAKIENVENVLTISNAFLVRNPDKFSTNLENITSLHHYYPEINQISLIASQEDLLRYQIFSPHLIQKQTSDVYIYQKKIPLMSVYSPARVKDSSYFGLVAQINLQKILGVLDGLQVGPSGKIMMVDSKGRIIAHKDPSVWLSFINPVYHEVFTKLQAGFSGSMELSVGENKKRRLIAYTPVGVYGWGLIIDRSLEEAYIDLDRMKMQSLVLIGLGCLIAIFISYLLARFIRGLINKLIKGIDKISSGDYSYRFRIQRRDEIGKLLFSFNKMAEKLKKAQKAEKLSVMGKAASKIAHELKNSLLLVNTFINMIPQKHKDKEFINEFSETIPKELDYWNKMLKQMMDAARPEKVSMEYIEINDLLTEIITLAKFGLEEKKIKIQTQFKEEIPPVFGDIEKLKQVFLNLLTNSIEATPKNGEICMETNFVDFNPGWTATFLEIKVSNSCVNMSDIDPEKIFDPFYTTKKDGAGLGLSICREIIKQHGGVIEVQNDKKKGISFSVQLPINKDLISK